MTLAQQFAEEAGAVAALTANPRPRVAEIQQAVCAYYELKPMDMISEQRTKWIARPRQIGMYLAHTLTPLSLSQIGSLFGNRDHSTVIHAVKQVRYRIEREGLASDIAAISIDLAARVEARVARIALEMGNSSLSEI